MCVPDPPSCLPQNIRLNRRVIILFMMWVLQVLATFGVVISVTLYTRTSVVPAGSSTLTTTDGRSVIQTAPFSQQSTLSSALPNEAFTSMTHFTATSPSGSFIQLLVLGFARIQGSGTFGSTVQLLTYAGTVTLDGRTIAFEDSVAPVFAAAGFSVSSDVQAGRRHLLDVGTDIAGFFSYMASFDLSALEASAMGVLAAPDTSFTPFPTSYSMAFTVYSVCDYKDDPRWCSGDGAAYTVPHPDFPGHLFFWENVSVVVRPSSVLSTSTFSYDGDRTDVTLLLKDNDLIATASSFSRSPDPWSNCVTQPSGQQTPTIFSYIQAQGIPPSFVGDAENVLGTPARHFSFTAAGVVLDYYDTRGDPTHVPLRFMASYPQQNVVFIDITTFNDESYAGDQALSWPVTGIIPRDRCPPHLAPVPQWPGLRSSVAVWHSSQR